MKKRTTKRSRRALIALVIVLCVVCASAITVYASIQPGASLNAGVSLRISMDRTWNWSIQKTVCPDKWDLFKGDDATSAYTVNVTKKGYTDAISASGKVTVTNSGYMPTENLAIQVKLLAGDSLQDPPGIVNVNTADKPVLQPGESGEYPFSFALAGAAGQSYIAAADVSITNDAGHMGSPFATTAQSDAQVAAPGKEINASVTVQDTFGDAGSPWTFADSGSVSYTRTFGAGDSGTFKNTATIVETGQSASANVKVNRYDIGIVKTACTSFIRRYDWTIDKSADQQDIKLESGKTASVKYTVKVTASGVDSAFAAAGTITITNPAPIDAVINSISDVMSDNTAVKVTPAVTFPYILKGNGGTLVLHYCMCLPDKTKRTNTATVLLQNYSYSAYTRTAVGTTAFTGKASIAFGDPSRTIDQTATVMDTLKGCLGDVNAADAPKTWQYTLTFGPSGIVKTGTSTCAPACIPTYTTNCTTNCTTTCKPTSVKNIATVTAQDTGTEKSDSWVVNISSSTTPCKPPCNVDYWKKQCGCRTGCKDDKVTPICPISLGDGKNCVKLDNNKEAYDCFNKCGNTSNDITRLYAQLLAAKLNMKNGADCSSVKQCISSCDFFLSKCNEDDWSSLSYSDKNKVNGWCTTLDKFNSCK